MKKVQPITIFLSSKYIHRLYLQSENNGDQAVNNRFLAVVGIGCHPYSHSFIKIDVKLTATRKLVSFSLNKIGLVLLYIELYKYSVHIDYRDGVVTLICVIFIYFILLSFIRPFNGKMKKKWSGDKEEIRATLFI